MNKRFEKYNSEELKSTLLNSQERDKLITHIYEDVFKIIYKYLHVEDKKLAKDFLHQAAIDLVLNVEKFRCGANPLQSLKAFWAGIAVNHIKKQNEKKGRMPLQIPLSDYENEIIQEVDFDDSTKRKQFFYKAFLKLGEDCQTIIRFVKLEGKSYEDLQKEEALLEKIGRKGAKSENLRDKLRQCRKKFENFLSEYFDDNGHLKPNV